MVQTMIYICLAVACLCVSVDAATSQTSPTDPENAFVENLLSTMSLRDKIAQMAQLEINALVEDDGNGGKRVNDAQAQKFLQDYGVGSVLNLINNLGDDAPWTTAQYRAIAMQLQSYTQQGNKPPVIWGIDNVHGSNYFQDGTWAPSPLNLAATFNASYATMAGQWASHDTRVAGMAWVFSPLLGISWAQGAFFSRIYETFGEDPYWVGEMATAMIQGIEGPDTIDTTTIPSQAAACGKHFVGYSLPRTGHDRAPSWIPTRHLYQYFLKPWFRALKETNLQTIMESYTETDGVPNVANPRHLRYLLRYRLKFEGVLVTDYAEINNLNDWHKIVQNEANLVKQSTEYALREGTVDMSMVPWTVEEFIQSTQQAVENGVIDEHRIHESAKRILKLKYRLKMFDEILTVENAGQVANQQGQALEMTKDSLILVENKNDFLPLKADENGLKVLVTGPTSNSRIAQTGGWTVGWQGPTDENKSFTTGSTVYGALLEQVSSQGDSIFTSVTYKCGTDFLGGECTDEDEDDDNARRRRQQRANRDLGFLDGVTDVGKQIESGIKGVGKDISDGVSDVGDWMGWNGHSSSQNHTSIERAVDAAQDVDMVVVCVGEEAYAEKPGDIRLPYLPLGQVELVRRLRVQYPEKPILVTYFGGRPRLLGDIADMANAFVVAFLPGPYAGQALVEMTTGQYNPSARLPITYPKFADGGGSPYFHAVSDQCTKGDGILPHWEYAPCQVQWPFGHGLSFSNFVYSSMTVSGDVVSGVTVTVRVKNEGPMSGAETIMIFTFDDFRRTTPEYKRLRATEKVWLDQDESKTLEFTIPSEDFEFVGPHDDHHYILDPSMSFCVGVGPQTDCRADSSNDLCQHVDAAEKDTSETFSPSCNAACDLWMKDDAHSCGELYGFGSYSDCVNACRQSNRPIDYASVGTEGWGWNYVDCLESVIWGFEQFGSSSNPDCSKLRTLCRDVFASSAQGWNEFGLGGSSTPLGSGGPEPIAGAMPSSVNGGTSTIIPGPSFSQSFFALMAGLIATIILLFSMKGVALIRILDKESQPLRSDPTITDPAVELPSMSSGSYDNHNNMMTGGQHNGGTHTGNFPSRPSELLGRIERHKRGEFTAISTA